MAIGASSVASSAASKKVPASIDALLADQRQKKEAESRPKFMTKAEREALVQAKLKDQSAAKADKDKEAAKRREELERAARIERDQQYQANDRHSYGSGRSGQYNNRDRDRERDGRLNYGNGNNNGAPSGPRAMRGNDQRNGDRNYDRRQQQQQPVASSSTSGASSKPAATNGDVPVFDPAALKARYLGDTSNKKRKVRKQSDKKFVFDWDKGEDTATADEVDPFYRALREGGHDSSTMSAMRPRPTSNGQALGAHTRSENWPGATIKKEEGDMEEDRPLAGPVAKTKTKAKGIIDERHWSEKTLAEMKDRDWRIFREDFSIAARGGQIPLPIRSWKEAGIPEALVDIVGEIGYAEPSPIQRQSIPIGLNIRDMIGIAETGSGKTAAFVIPMLSYIMKLPPLSDANRHMGPYALILAPTRELAQQIEVETRKFTSRLGFRCVSIVGGRSMEEQALNLRDGAEIIIATPGRLKDCIERSIVVFSQCTYVVMDEADRMISLGFEDVINFILDSLPVSNMKPDSEEAEDAGKMLQTLIGGEDGQPLSDVYMYRQTVRTGLIFSLKSA
jgi:ATP-dependent RNA helicase DDX23/PRP28